MATEEPIVTFSADSEKKALEIKYLLEMSSESNQDELLQILNRLHPFIDCPLNRVPPVELIESA